MSISSLAVPRSRILESCQRRRVCRVRVYQPAALEVLHGLCVHVAICPVPDAQVVHPRHELLQHLRRHPFGADTGQEYQLTVVAVRASVCEVLRADALYIERDKSEALVALAVLLTEAVELAQQGRVLLARHECDKHACGIPGGGVEHPVGERLDVLDGRAPWHPDHTRNPEQLQHRLDTPRRASGPRSNGMEVGVEQSVSYRVGGGLGCVLVERHLPHLHSPPEVQPEAPPEHRVAGVVQERSRVTNEIIQPSVQRSVVLQDVTPLVHTDNLERECRDHAVLSEAGEHLEESPGVLVSPAGHHLTLPGYVFQLGDVVHEEAVAQGSRANAADGGEAARCDVVVVADHRQAVAPSPEVGVELRQHDA